MPPLTPRRMRAIATDPCETPRSGAVVVIDLARRELLERDRQVIARGRIDHGGRELLVAALTERSVVAIELARALRRHQDGGVVGVGSAEELVDAGLDH